MIITRRFHSTQLVLALSIMAAIAGIAAPARAAEFTLDRNHTIGSFTVQHLGISKVTGVLPLVSGTATIGADNLPSGASATFDVKRIDTRNDKRDDSLRSPDFFDVEKFPTLSFVAKQVEGTPSDFKMTGDLTFHGITKSVTMTGSMEGQLAEAARRHVTFSLRTKLDRRDWGLKWGDTIPGGALIAGNEVTIEVEVDAVTPTK